MVKGLYTIFIDNFKLIKNYKLEPILNHIKGKINNYFNFSINNNSCLYIFKSKLLKDFIDNGIQFSSVEMIIKNIYLSQFPKMNYIPISLCPNNNHTPLAYVTMSSILSSKATNTYICFYLVIPDDFDNKNIKFFDTLYELYSDFNMTFIRMDNRYDKAYADQKITKHAYYRFSIGELLPNLNKIIYFDTDIIVYKDLSKFYNINFNGKIILGQPTIGNRNTIKNGFFLINTGILLLNLFEMRKIRFEKKVIEIIQKGEKLSFHDQTLLNNNFKQYVGVFPPEYHSRPWTNYREIEIYNYKIGNIFDQDYLYFANKYPTIRHFLGKYKAKNRKTNHVEDWWFFARKSRYYNNCSESYSNAFSY